MPTMKRLLVIGTSAPERLETFYLRAFAKLNVEVTLFDPDDALKWCQGGRIRNRITLPLQHLFVARALRKFYSSPRWDAVLVFKGSALGVDALLECRSRGDVPWAVLNPDSPFDPGIGASNRHIRASVPHFDLYFIWSRKLLEPLREAGCKRPVYIPFAYDEQSHRPANALDSNLSRIVTFVGTCDSQRQSVMESLADLPVRVYGAGWDRLSPKSKLRDKISEPVFGDDLRRVITSSLACLNIMRPQNADAHNMRTFEVPAMGGLMIATRSAENQDYFPEHEASLMFKDRQELRDLVVQLLSNEIDVVGIRRRAHERSFGHTYLERARQILRVFAEL